MLKVPDTHSIIGLVYLFTMNARYDLNLCSLERVVLDLEIVWVESSLVETEAFMQSGLVEAEAS